MLPVPKLHASAGQPSHSHSGSTSNASAPAPSAFPQFLSNTNRHRSSKSQSSLLRLSRTNTNATDFPTIAGSVGAGTAGAASGFGEEQSIRSTDKVASARPSVNYSDKLWTQIDVLDDVKNMSTQVKLRGSFFNDAFNEELTKLKSSQNKLLEVMSSHQAKIKEKEQQKQMYPSGNASSRQMEHRESVAGAGAATLEGSASPPRGITPIPSRGLSAIPTNEHHLDEAAATATAPTATAPTATAPTAAAGGALRAETEEKDQLGSFFKDEHAQSKNILYRKQDLLELDKYIEETRLNLEVVGEAMKNFDETTRELW